MILIPLIAMELAALAFAGIAVGFLSEYDFHESHPVGYIFSLAAVITGTIVVLGTYAEGKDAMRHVFCDNMGGDYYEDADTPDGPQKLCVLPNGLGVIFP